MDIKIIHYTFDLCGNKSNQSSDDRDHYDPNNMVILAGREAGICYMPDDYFSEKISNNKSAERRANMILGTGHHSPFDHGSIGIEISGIPKILVMLLNSTAMYTTSEKSGRYTVMRTDNIKENEIYNKWREIYYDLIMYTYPDMEHKQAEKLALENARYMLSVFTPTSLGFTTTFRQFSYLYYWLGEFISNIETRCYNSRFYTKLIPYCKELRDLIYPITNGIVEDHKSMGFQFMPEVFGHELPTLSSTPAYSSDQLENCYCGSYGNVYEINYENSFAYLAQAQRHRTLHYEMGSPENIGACYIPRILSISDKPEKYNDMNLVDMWKNDFNELKHEFPQCSLVPIYETGRVDDFLLKCKERLCGRAQLEIADRTAFILEDICKTGNRMSERSWDTLKTMVNLKEIEIVPKCGFKGYKCKEPCRWGKLYGLHRLI